MEAIAFAVLIVLPMVGVAAVIAWGLREISRERDWDRQQEAAWARRAEAESRAVLDRIARGEERTYTAAEVREMLRREREEPNS